MLKKKVQYRKAELLASFQFSPLLKLHSLVNTYKIMIPIEDILETFEEDCTYNNLSAEQWANQAEELEKELNLYKYMAKM